MNVIPADQKQPVSSGMGQFNEKTILLGRSMVGYE